MKAALIVGGLGIVLVILTPALRTLRRSNARMSDAEYFAAARKRAIEYRVGKSAARQSAAEMAGDE